MKDNVMLARAKSLRLVMGGGQYIPAVKACVTSGQGLIGISGGGCQGGVSGEKMDLGWGEGRGGSLVPVLKRSVFPPNCI